MPFSSCSYDPKRDDVVEEHEHYPIRSVGPYQRKMMVAVNLKMEQSTSLYLKFIVASLAMPSPPSDYGIY